MSGSNKNLNHIGNLYGRNVVLLKIKFKKFMRPKPNFVLYLIFILEFHN
jgi:hypothetical protein